MKKIVVIFCAAIAFTACSGSSNTSGSNTGANETKSNNFTNAAAMRDALNAASLTCTEYELISKADRELGLEGASEVAGCEVEGDNIQLVIWKDNGQRDNYDGQINGFGCMLAKLFVIQTIDWVNGNEWTINNVSQTLAEKFATTFGGKARHADC